MFGSCKNNFHIFAWDPKKIHLHGWIAILDDKGRWCKDNKNVIDNLFTCVVGMLMKAHKMLWRPKVSDHVSCGAFQYYRIVVKDESNWKKTFSKEKCTTMKNKIDNWLVLIMILSKNNCSVAQRKHVGLMSQRFDDRNLAEQCVFSCSEVVITLDFESSIPGSNPGKRILYQTFYGNMNRKRTPFWFTLCYQHKLMQANFMVDFCQFLEVAPSTVTSMLDL